MAEPARAIDDYGSEAVSSSAPCRGTAGGEESEQTSRTSSLWWTATGLLGGMTALFIVTGLFKGQYGWLGGLHAFAEAAMVGALADWFAVTALFRHPFGIPIPHTAIVPQNKARIGRSLGLFIQKNFLSEQVLESEAVNMSGALARWLSQPGNKDAFLRRLRVVVRRSLEFVETHDAKRFIDQQIELVLREVDVAKGLGKLLRALTVDGAHDLLLDEVAVQSKAFFRNNQDWFRQQLREASPWFVPDFVDRRIALAFIDKTEATLTAFVSDRNHELRVRLRRTMDSFIDSLESSPEMRQRGYEVRDALLSNEVFRSYIGSLRDSLVRELYEDAARERSVIAQAAETVITAFVREMESSPEVQRRVNRVIRVILRSVVGESENRIADLIARTIDRWDSSTLVRRLEEHVGSDLQYIRINGTLVGGAVGLILYCIGRSF